MKRDDICGQDEFSHELLCYATYLIGSGFHKSSYYFPFFFLEFHYSHNLFEDNKIANRQLKLNSRFCTSNLELRDINDINMVDNQNKLVFDEVYSG